MKRTLRIMRFALPALLVLAALPARSAMAQAEAAGPSDQEKALHYSLYYENYKNGNFAEALPDLKWMLENAPGFPQNDDRNFERAWKAYEGLAEQAGDDAARRAYLDSALTVFETAVPLLEGAGVEVDAYDWTFEKGRFIQTHAEHMPDLQVRASEQYLQAWEMAPTRLAEQPYYIDFIIYDVASSGNRERALEFMDEIEETVEVGEDVSAILSKYRGMLITTGPERIEYLEGKLEKDPTDIGVAEELLGLYQEEGMRDEAMALATRLNESNPSAKTSLLLAKMYLGDGEYARAFALYEQAANSGEVESKLREVYYNMGLAKQNLGQLASARTYFRKALEVDPQFGAALIAIGDLYVTAVNNCGSLERADRAVYWLATDYYERARSADSGVANAARSKINSIRPAYPSAEDKFFWGVSSGQRYKVEGGCYGWIGESTTVR